MTLEEKQLWFRDLQTSVHRPMAALVARALREGVFTRFARGSEVVPRAYVELSLDRGLLVTANFMVQHGPEGWSVHQLRYHRVQGVLELLAVPVQRFEILPTREWLRKELEHFFDAERRGGCLSITDTW